MAGLFPTASFTGSYQRVGEGSAASGGAAVAPTPGVAGTGGTSTPGTTGSTGGRTLVAGGSGETNFFQVGFDASWELDVFGGIRRGIEAADANIGAAMDNERTALVTLTGEVGVDYIQLRGYQRQIAVVRENLRARRELLDLTELRLRVGTATGLDVAQAQAQVAATESQIPPLEASIRQKHPRAGRAAGQGAHGGCRGRSRRPGRSLRPLQRCRRACPRRSCGGGPTS